MEQEERFMIIKMGTKHYGIKINDIKEFVPNTEITHAHNAESAYIYRGEKGEFPARMEKTDYGGERLREMAGRADDGTDSPAAA